MNDTASTADERTPLWVYPVVFLMAGVIFYFVFYKFSGYLYSLIIESEGISAGNLAAKASFGGLVIASLFGGFWCQFVWKRREDLSAFANFFFWFGCFGLYWTGIYSDIWAYFLQLISPFIETEYLSVVSQVTIGILVIIVYLLPSIIALVRSHHSKLAVFFLNLTLGWTIVGWIASLVWSGVKVRKNDL